MIVGYSLHIIRMNHVVPRASGHQQFFRDCLCSGRNPRSCASASLIIPLIIPLIYAATINSFLLYYNYIKK